MPDGVSWLNALAPSGADIHQSVLRSLATGLDADHMHVVFAARLELEAAIGGRSFDVGSFAVLAAPFLAGVPVRTEAHPIRFALQHVAVLFDFLAVKVGDLLGCVIGIERGD